MSFWPSDIFGVSRERNQNEEWIRKQSRSEQGQEEPIPISEKERKTANLWIIIGLAIIVLIFIAGIFLL
jgi:hypothetical protein